MTRLELVRRTKEILWQFARGIITVYEKRRQLKLLIGEWNGQTQLKI